MQEFSDAGIYLFVDLDTFATYIDPVCHEQNRLRRNDWLIQKPGPTELERDSV